MPNTDKNIRATAATIPRIKLKNPSSKPTTKRQKAAPSLHALRKQYRHDAICIIVMVVDDGVNHTMPHELQLSSFQLQNIGKHNTAKHHTALVVIVIVPKSKDWQTQYANHVAE
jgi:hypothetical protein